MNLMSVNLPSRTETASTPSGGRHIFSSSNNHACHNTRLSRFLYAICLLPSCPRCRSPGTIAVRLCSTHRRPAGRGRANPPPLPLLTLGPKASNARLILSLLSTSSAETGVAGSEGGRGTCEADSVGFGDGDGRGRPNAPPKLGAAALEANAARAGVGKEDEWVGLEGSKLDLRYDSVRSAKSEVSI